MTAVVNVALFPRLRCAMVLNSRRTDGEWAQASSWVVEMKTTNLSRSWWEASSWITSRSCLYRLAVSTQWCLSRQLRSWKMLLHQPSTYRLYWAWNLRLCNYTSILILWRSLAFIIFYFTDKVYGMHTTNTSQWSLEIKCIKKACAYEYQSCIFSMLLFSSSSI